jgi:hypothetical protein
MSDKKNEQELTDEIKNTAGSDTEESASPEVPTESTSSQPSETEDSVINFSKGGRIPWEVDPEHKNAVKVLSEKLEAIELIGSDPQKLPSRALNFVLVVLIIGVGGGGGAVLQHYSSPDRAARLMEVAVCKKEFSDRTQLLNNKQYGTLRIESEPKQASVSQSINGAPYVKIKGKTAEGVEMDTLTPATISNLDINAHYKFKLEFTDTLKRIKEDPEADKKKKKKGEDKAKTEEAPKEIEYEELKVAYRSEEFHVDRYQWIQDGATGTYRFQKPVKMISDEISHYYSFDWKTKKDMEFESASDCKAHTLNNDATICRAVPRVKNFETEEARLEEEAKKKKRRGR